jgi:hypothetical protein
MYFGRSPTGRAIRFNVGFVTSPHISTAIPNAKAKTSEYLKRTDSCQKIPVLNLLIINILRTIFLQIYRHEFVFYFIQVYQPGVWAKPNSRISLSGMGINNRTLV